MMLNIEYTLYLLQYIKTLYQPFLTPPTQATPTNAITQATPTLDQPAQATPTSEIPTQAPPTSEVTLPTQAPPTNNYSLKLSVTVINPQLVLLATPTEPYSDAIIAQVLYTIYMHCIYHVYCIVYYI